MNSQFDYIEINHGYNDIKLIVEVDKSLLTNDVLKKYVYNHHEFKSFLHSANGDYLSCFLMLLAKECYRVSLCDELTLQGLIEHFENPTSWRTELFPSLSGGAGLRLVNFEYAELDPNLFEVL